MKIKQKVTRKLQTVKRRYNKKRVNAGRKPRKIKIEAQILPAPSPKPPANVKPQEVTVETSPTSTKKRRRGKNNSRMYFTQETEDAIVAYNQCEDQTIREKIFSDKILYPLQKLVENVFNTFKFSYFETGPQDVQKECLTHLVANMRKFDPSRLSKTDPKKKTKAYSYFSIIAKHYLILLNNTNYKKFNQNVEISDDKDEHTIQLQAHDKYHDQAEMADFIKLIVEFWEKNADKIFTKQRDLNIANAVVELFRNSDRIDAFNKKALYLYIREMAMCKTQQITKVINKMKQYHDNIQKSYIETGVINTERHAIA
jgi:hypothetical protein